VYAPQTADQSNLSQSVPNTQTLYPTTPDLLTVSKTLTINKQIHNNYTCNCL